MLKKKLKMNTDTNLSKLNTSSSGYKSQFNDVDDQPSEIVCLFCETLFILPTNEKEFLTHLYEKHQLVIGDVKKIASLKSYIRYWRMRFKDQRITEFCTTLEMKNDPTLNASSLSNTGQLFYLLSDCLPEDKALREELAYAKLEWALSEQVKERTDTTFKRGCMFCRTDFSGSRLEYIKHLCQKHNILLGKPENLVFIDDYLDKIQNNIESFICIYCEKTFKNRIVLKEHMRKKFHKQVNPNNKSYDKYYIENYVPNQSNQGKIESAEKDLIETEDFLRDSDSEDEDWSVWNDNIKITCLFCKHSAQDFTVILQHMEMEHGFNFVNITKDYVFYEKVKIVNYIRRQINSNRCIYCDASADDLIAHMDVKSHYKLPEKETWNQPGFYFPTFDGDSFLYSLDTNSDDEEVIT